MRNSQLALAITLVFSGAVLAQTVTTGNARPTNGSTITATTKGTTSSTASGATTTNTQSSIPLPATTGPATSNSSPATTSITPGNTSGTSSTTGSGNAPSAADATTLPPSNLTSGTANNLPTGTDNSAAPTSATPAPFDSGGGTVLGAPVVGAPAVAPEEFTIGPNGERIPVNRTATAVANPSEAQNLAASRALDARLEKSARDTRARVERKGQVLNSITPRTDVDRTDQMPDDSTPLLSPSRR